MSSGHTALGRSHPPGRVTGQPAQRPFFGNQWEEGFTRLLRYVERHGDARVAQSYAVDGYNLGQWVINQRSNRSKGTLSPDRERRLQELPGWTWNARSSSS